MATLPPNYSLIQPRKSTETDRRHLLADSVVPSEAASEIVDFADGDRTPLSHSPVRGEDSSSQFKIPAGQAHERRDTIAAPSEAPRPYKGFPSEAHYLAALNEWAESKKYIYYDKSLIGFYGQKTMGDYANQAGGVELGLRKKWKARKERKAEQKMERRNTVT